MIHGFTETQIIAGLVAVLVASYTTFFGWLVNSIHGLRREMRETRIELTGRLDAVDAKFTAKIDALTVAVSRLDGAVYHGLPEPRRAIQE